MNRREATKSIVVATLGVAIRFPASLSASKESNQTANGARFPRSVAGVQIVDTRLAQEATELARTSSPPYLFHHVMRTYLFAALVGNALKLRFDEETLYVACVLHDLGLTETFMGDLPFEIQGAEEAKKFLLSHGMDASRTSLVWDGIAMHPLPIGQFKSPEVALVGGGAGADVLGPDSSQISQTQTAEILSAFPRLGFKTEFVKTCADVVHRHPRGASRTFMRDIAERTDPTFRPRNFCDAIAQAPFIE